MTNTYDNISHGAQSQLAKLLAMENISVQHQASAKTAMFDVKNRVLILPVWRQMTKDLYDMLVIHEVGHALDTPMFVDEIVALAKKLGARPAVIKGFFNVIEDARIDKRQKRRYPGSRRNYIKGYQELLEKDFFGTARRDVNAMMFIDRINIHFKAGAMSGVKFSSLERPFLKRIEDAETVDEVFTLVEDIYLFSKQQRDENREGNEPSEDDADDDFEFEDGDDFEFDDGDDFEDGDEDEEGEETSGKSSRKSDDEGDEDTDDADSDDAEENSDEDSDGNGKSRDIEAGSEGDNKSNDDLDVPETEKAWEKKQEELLANSDINYNYVKIPTAKDISKFVDDYKIVHKQMSDTVAANTGKEWLNAVRDELNKFRTEENATISYMVKEFEMRKSADEYRRTATAKTGMIDTNKLHSYKYNDDIFRRITSVAEGKNHGFVMIIDWSGSMQHNLKKTLKQLFSLAWFCKRVQIPFEVYSFRTIVEVDGVTDYSGFFSQNPGELEMKAFKLRNILSSRMNVAELNTALLNLWAFASGCYMRCDNMGSTPLNEALAVAHHLVNAFKQRTKVQVVNTVVLTDGESDGNWVITGHTATGKRTKYIIHDEITKKDFELGMTSYGFNFGRQLTDTLLKILKERTGCNLIGFYVCNESIKSVLDRHYGWNHDEKFAKEQKKLYETNGFIPVTNAGYDEYYILRAASMDIVKTDLKIDANMTKSKIKSAFLAFAEKKAVNRVLLQRFIKKIAA